MTLEADSAVSRRSANSLKTFESTPWLLIAFCFAFTLVPSYVVSKAFFASFGSPARIIGALGLALAALALLRLNSRPRQHSVNPGILILLLFLCVLAIVWGFGLTHLGTPTQEAIKKTALFAYLPGPGIALYAIATIKTTRQRTIILACLALGITYSAVVGLFQYLGIGDYSDLIQPLGFEVDQRSRLPVELVDKLTGELRAYGTFAQGIPFAVICAATVPIALHLGRYAPNRGMRATAAIIVIALLAAIPTGVSRSGIIALATGLFCYAWTLSLRQLASATGVLALIVGIYAVAVPKAIPMLVTKVAGSADDPSVLIRIDQISRMNEIFDQHPVIGTGLASITMADFGVIDNTWAIIMAEGGMVGIFGYTLFFLGGIAGFIGSVRRSNSDAERDQSYALGAAFIALSVTSPYFFFFGFDATQFSSFLLFGLLWSRVNNTVDPQSNPPLATGSISSLYQAIPR